MELGTADGKSVGDDDGSAVGEGDGANVTLQLIGIRSHVLVCIEQMIAYTRDVHSAKLG